MKKKTINNETSKPILHFDISLLLLQFLYVLYTYLTELCWKEKKNISNFVKIEYAHRMYNKI